MKTFGYLLSRQGIDTTLVTTKRLEHLTGCRIPHLNCLVAPPGNDPATVGTEGCYEDGAIMRTQGCDRLVLDMIKPIPFPAA